MKRLNHKEAAALFREYAIKHNFWWRYKKAYIEYNKSGRTFLENIEKNEPCKMIQSTNCFCCWPYKDNTFWANHSKNWMIYCNEMNIYYNKEEMMEILDISGVI